MVKGDEDDNFQVVNELEYNDNIENKQDEPSAQPRSHDKLVGGSQAKRGNSWGVWGRCKFGGAPKIMGFLQYKHLDLLLYAHLQTFLWNKLNTQEPFLKKKYSKNSNDDFNF